MLVTLDSIRPLVRNTVVTTLSAVMSHVRGDISLVIRIATIIEIFGHVLGIFWAYLGHTLGIRNGQTGLVLVLVMVWSVTDFVFSARVDF